MNEMKVALVTGANRGIGLELTKQLVTKGWRVFASCRAPSDALNALNLNGGMVIDGIDVTSKEGISRIVNGVEGNRFDLIINNAGVLTLSEIDDLDADSIRHQFEVNTLSPLILTSALLKNDTIKSGAVITMVSSIGASIQSQKAAPGGSMGLYGYKMTKCALNMASVCLAKDLAPRGISVLIIHPGAVNTDMLDQLVLKMGKIPGTISPSESADGILKRIELTTLETSGQFFHVDGTEMPW